MLLAIDTATRWMSIALHDGQRVHYEATWHTTNNHTIELTPTIHRALIQVKVTPADLSAVAVAIGPGSFTGLRIGLGVAKGLALAQNLALVAVPTLDIVAAAVPVSDNSLLAVLQAGRGRICVQRYQRQDDTWTPAEPAAIITWAKLLDTVETDTLLAGEINDEAVKLLASTVLPIRVIPSAHTLRRAGFLADIAWMRVRAGAVDDPFSVTPSYLHQPGVPHP
ncbi:MAG: tRNA (adenosine(37)-N6)-threonylcarbamoyltransferase complex dimerization subunit type 1 TsaB [Anaerolineae bacterium]|nr:tRNA (adenosine(37)-N6)-threonylcarbamoyltransferase complex dimerization subunit type 1 TsaB [Anaerolineae bacterium]